MIRRLIRRLLGPADERAAGGDEAGVCEVYETLLGRPPGADMADALALLARAGRTGLTDHLLHSEEFRARPPEAAAVELPDLTDLIPDAFYRTPRGALFMDVRDAAGLRRVEALIREHRYYDSGVAWRPIIDLDKRVTAAALRSLGARSVIELGCYAGSVLKVLDDAGVAVTGVEISHNAFRMAHDEVRDRIRYGDLLELDLPRGGFDAVLAMDILEHLSPLDLDAYAARIAELMAADGFAYVNSPMFGPDDVFGTVFPAYLPAWREAGDESWWTHFHCDPKGWPAHGHLVWASPRWWERLFARHGLVRDREVERQIQARMETFFAVRAPARKSVFVLRHAGAAPMDGDQVEARMRALLDPLLVDPTAP